MPMKKHCVAALGVALMLAAQSGGMAAEALVRQLSLGELCDRAESIVRARVLGSVAGSVEIAGASLPTVTYRLEVIEWFKGELPRVKNDLPYAEITMLGPGKRLVRTPREERLPLLPDLPRLAPGKEYLLLTTRPSALGLSTTVGLGQGCFEVSGIGKAEKAVNANGNRGLALAIDGPVDYDLLAAEIRRALTP